MVERYESDQMMRQFGCMQRIPSPPQELEYLYNNKPYLLLASERSKQHLRRKPRQGPINPRSGEDVVVGSTSAPSTLEDLIAMQPPNEAEVDEESPKKIVRQNPRRASRPPGCGTHSGHR
ncbi:hypothetical protein Golob_005866 [Gossypium lobatum]|uniref:Uncharacterized protein n=1 Tax=Gossypium lobatum TaxID=34289 RepID=A0A7J8MUH4_9ROSI|nr:hypothetical protein [Gossypium lobatum]